MCLAKAPVSFQPELANGRRDPQLSTAHVLDTPCLRLGVDLQVVTSSKFNHPLHYAVIVCCPAPLRPTLQPASQPGPPLPTPPLPPCPAVPPQPEARGRSSRLSLRSSGIFSQVRCLPCRRGLVTRDCRPQQANANLVSSNPAERSPAPLTELQDLMLKQQQMEAQINENTMVKSVSSLQQALRHVCFGIAVTLLKRPTMRRSSTSLGTTMRCTSWLARCWSRPPSQRQRLPFLPGCSSLRSR